MLRYRPSVHHVWILMLTALAATPYSATRAAVLQTDVRLSSDSTGGGTLAVRVFYPDNPAGFRYGAAGGAPVLVAVPGGFDAGTLSVNPFFSQQGFVTIVFLFPGGAQGPIRSDGVYDDRGDACHRAVRDVLRFAAGTLRSVDGRTVSQIAGGPTRTDAVGLIGLSNGGSINIATLGRYGEQIPPLGFVVGWESPTSDQILTTEMGSKEADPNQNVDSDGDGFPANDGPNPAYMAYGFPRADVAYSRLRFDPAYTYSYRNTPGQYRGLFYFDNNGNGRFDPNPPGTLRTDSNGNGRVDATEDYPIAGHPTTRADGSFVAYLSVPAAQAAATAGLAVPWPAHIGTPSETQAYWGIRNATLFFGSMAAKQRQLAGMTVYSIVDHVQIATDHPHVHHYLDGFRSNGLWYRLNPDQVYARAVLGNPTLKLVDNDANMDVAPSEMQSRAEPSGAPSSNILQAAAVAEMSDRVVYQVWDANLTHVLTPADSQPPTTTTAPTTSTTSTSSTSTTSSSTTSSSTTSTLAPSTTTTTANTTTTTLPVTAAARYFSFVVNCHDWVTPDRSAATLTFVMDTLERYGLRGEFYMTAPLVEALLQRHPPVIERMKQSQHTISYHVRPPHPVSFSPTRHYLETYSVADYETYHLDLRTGDLDLSRSGGYDYVAQVFGRQPSAVGLGTRSAELQSEYAAVLAARGARVGVFEHQTNGQTGFEALHHPEQGLYPRPNDYFIARTDDAGHPNNDGDFWWKRISDGQLSVDALAAAFTHDFLTAQADPAAPLFGVLVIHENDFYSTATPWGPVYFADAQNSHPLEPPYDLTATAPWVQPRTEAQQRAIRDAFEALVRAAASSSGVSVVTSEDVSGLADGYMASAPLPTWTVEWLQQRGVEADPPEAYAWEEGTLPGNVSSSTSTFSLTSGSAHSGRRGLSIDTGSEGSLVLQARVDISKGKSFTFGGWVRASGPGSISMALIPVDWVRGTLQPVVPGKPATTDTLTGALDWTQLSATTYATANFAYALLQITVQGGGTWQLDDFTVNSEEDAPLAFPAAPRGQVHIGFLIHIEDVPGLTTNTPYYRAKTQVFKDLAEIFHRNAARMTIQPELEWVRGVAATEPDLIRRLHEQYGVDFSVHTHGPKNPNPTVQDAIDYILERKQAMESAGSGPVTDLNGNFDLPDWSVFSAAGIRSMTAFKNTRTQACYAGDYFHPWRPSPGNPYTNEAAWAVDNPASTVVYLPGSCTQVSKYSNYLMSNIIPGLSYSLANAGPDQITTWYFIGHVDSFVPTDGSSLDTYMASERYQQDLRAYDKLLGEVLGPLVRRGFAVWASPAEMRAAFEATAPK